jgi:hypothetical protein
MTERPVEGIVGSAMTVTAPTQRQRPAIVEEYIARAEAATPRGVRITQAGEMWLKPGGRALLFDAVEDLWVEQVAFTWHAKVRVAPFVSMRVVDGYSAGQGSLVARLFGAPVVRSSGPGTDEGEAMRYLAELAWVPQAMRANRKLEWRQVEENIVQVSTSVGSAKVAVGLRFDDAGDILAAFAHRPRLEGKEIVAEALARGVQRLCRARRHPHSDGRRGSLGPP